MKRYLNFEKLYNDILSIYKTERDKYIEDEANRDALQEYDDEFLEECAYTIAEGINNDVMKYLTDHSMWIHANFNNIPVYERPAIVSAIERGCEQTLDRMTEWFWATFGTFGIRYNFQNWMSETIYQYEQTKC